VSTSSIFICRLFKEPTTPVAALYYYSTVGTVIYFFYRRLFHLWHVFPYQEMTLWAFKFWLDINHGWPFASLYHEVLVFSPFIFVNMYIHWCLCGIWWVENSYKRPLIPSVSACTQTEIHVITGTPPSYCHSMRAEVHNGCMLKSGYLPWVKDDVLLCWNISVCLLLSTISFIPFVKTPE